MNVIVVLHNDGVAMVTTNVEKVKNFLKELVGDNKIEVEVDGEEMTLGTVDELHNMAELSGDCGESVICKFGCETGDDYCTLAITMREVE